MWLLSPEAESKLESQVVSFYWIVSLPRPEEQLGLAEAVALLVVDKLIRGKDRLELRDGRRDTEAKTSLEAVSRITRSLYLTI